MLLGNPGFTITAVLCLARSLPVFPVRTMEEMRQLSLWRYRLFGWFSAFGAAAQLLASLGSTACCRTR